MTDVATPAVRCATCRDTGSVSKVVPLADAVLISDKPCPDCRRPARRRLPSAK